MSARPRIRVALPWMHEAIAEARGDGTLPPMPEWCWLAGRGNATRAVEGDWREWLLAGVDATAVAALRRWPAGPTLAAAAGAGARVAAGWAVAQPVHLAAGIDHVRMAPLADATPSPAEAELLAATLRTHFSGDLFDLVDFVDGAWLLRCIEDIECTTHDPASIAGHDIHDHLPAGRDGARVRSLMNEVQMVLHEHPVNERRAGTRALPINALWLWGFGAMNPAPPALPAIDGWTLSTDDLWLRHFWRVHGGAERSLGGARTEPGDALVAVTQRPTPEPAEALAEVDSSLLGRLCRTVQTGDIQQLEVYDGSRVHVLDRHSYLRIWRRPVTPARL